MTDILESLRPKFVWENEYYEFYNDSWCEQFRQSLNRYDPSGISLDAKYVYLAISKENKEEIYVAFDSQGRPFMTWKDSWDFEVRELLHKNAVRDDCDIINMAKKRNEQ